MMQVRVSSYQGSVTTRRGTTVKWAQVWGDGKYLGQLVRRPADEPGSTWGRPVARYEVFKRGGTRPRAASGKVVRGAAQFVKRADALAALLKAWGKERDDWTLV